MRSFPFGRAAFIILLLSLFSGLALALNPPPRRTGTLRFWLFSRNHHDAYLPALVTFETMHPGVRVDLQARLQPGDGGSHSRPPSWPTSTCRTWWRSRSAARAASSAGR